MSIATAAPTKAVVLAAGLGQRLRPFTLFQPKPLMPIGGEPLIERSLRQLEDWGVTDIAVNLHWLAAPLRDYLEARRGKARVVFSREPALLGTAGALMPLREFAGEAPFWLVNADIVWRVKPAALLRARADGDALAAVWLVPGRGPRTVETDARGWIATYRSERRGCPGTTTFSGVQVVSPRIFNYLPPIGEAPVSLVAVYEAAARAGERVAGVVVAEGTPLWHDAGTVADYLRLHRQMERRRRKPVTNPGAATFTVQRGAVRFPAAQWPDPALAPALLRIGWPLAEADVEPLAARGSDRGFLRVHRNRESAIFVRYGRERAENFRYAGHARLLRESGVDVPGVLTDLPEARALVLEDVGGRCLRDAVLAKPGQAERLYRRTLDQVVRLHTAATRLARSRRLAMEDAFDRRLYEWERDLFLNQVVRARQGVGEVPSAVLMGEYGEVAERLLGVHASVIVHRDLQSTNVMLKGTHLALIDFQGMRYGAAAYDLASLLCDPYVSLPPDMRERLLARYAADIGGEAGAEAARLFPYGAVQRLTQALGAYGRLTALGLSGWEQHLIPAAARLAEMAERCGLTAIRDLALATVERERMRR